MARLLLGLTTGAVWAHASEQGFVLLLPTDVYIAAGGTTVALTVALLAVMPGGVAGAFFRPVPLATSRPRPHRILSLVATGILFWLIWRGLSGPRDPMLNPLSLTIWVVFWIALVSLHGLIGNLWRWINPWSGMAALVARITGRRSPLRYPRALRHWPGVLSFLVFADFLMADPAPADDASGMGLLIRRYAPTLLPIALAYRIAHYLTSLLLDGRYVLVRERGARHWRKPRSRSSWWDILSFGLWLLATPRGA